MAENLKELTIEADYKKEMNKIANAMRNLQKAKEKLHQAHKRYSEIIYNLGCKDWSYTDYEKILKNILPNDKVSRIKINNNPKVFDNILNLDKKYFEMFSISKEIVEFIEPKTIEDLALVFAFGSCNYKVTDKIEICKIFREIPKFVQPILKNTYNQILYEDQIKKILFKITKDKKSANALFSFMWDIRFVLHDYNIMEQIKNRKNLLEYVKEKYPESYALNLRIPFISIKENLMLINVKEQDINKIMDILIWGVTNSCKYKKAIKCAKLLYLVAESQVKLTDD